jgi:hypothetical protein
MTLELQRHPKLGRQARRGRTAERLQPALDPALLLGVELRREREVDGTHATAAAGRGRLLGQAPVARSVDERRDGLGDRTWLAPLTAAVGSRWTWMTGSRRVESKE